MNPSDYNQIEGTYPVQPANYPAFAGNEGVALVLQSDLPAFKKGDLVLPTHAALGTWRDFAWLGEQECFTLESLKSIPLELAACLTVNPPTAFRLVHDWALGAECIVQNAATSTVGQCIIQILKALNSHTKTVNIIRNDPLVSKVKAQKHHLMQLGATHVFTESEMQEESQFIRSLKPTVAFNAVGGALAGQMANLLADNASVVTYGAMSRRAMQIPAACQIFHNVQFRGFWMTRWYREHSMQERKQMIECIVQMMKEQKLKLSTVSVPLAEDSMQRVEHIQNQRCSALREKILLVNKARE